MMHCLICHQDVVGPHICGGTPTECGPSCRPRPMPPRPAFWTHDDVTAKCIGEHLYYFAPTNRRPPPYKTQRRVVGIIDIADDGTLAGVELIDEMPPPPTG
jgi:hypothetical protein